MKMKKLGAVLMAAAFMMSASAGVADAAKGGARISMPKVSAPAPKVSAPAKSSSGSTSSATKKDTPNTKDYAPSKKASEYGESAPTAKSNTTASTNSAAAANTAANSGTRWGSALRTMGMLAGGMMLGSMLSSLFGFGAGSWLADVLGVVANIAIIAFVLCILNVVIRKLMGKFTSSSRAGSTRQSNGWNTSNGRTRRREEEPVYTVDAEEVTEVKTEAAPVVHDIKPPSAAGSVAPGTYRDYDAHSTAERYRRM